MRRVARACNGSFACCLAGVLLASSVPAGAADLGRLFLGAGEREALDRARYESSIAAPREPAPPRPEPLEMPQEPAVPAQAITVDGYVQRSGGPPTVWINGVDSYQGNLAEFGIEARDLALDQARVRVPRAGGGTVRLKPGQSFDPEQSRVTEAWERAAVPVLELPEDLGLD
jgi:hypothetical protein